VPGFYLNIAMNFVGICNMVIELKHHFKIKMAAATIVDFIAFSGGRNILRCRLNIFSTALATIGLTLLITPCFALLTRGS